VSDVRENLAGILRRAAVRLREAGLPAEVSGRMETLAGQVHEPCVVAVVGRPSSCSLTTSCAPATTRTSGA